MLVCQVLTMIVGGGGRFGRQAYERSGDWTWTAEGPTHREPAPHTRPGGVYGGGGQVGAGAAGLRIGVREDATCAGGGGGRTAILRDGVELATAGGGGGGGELPGGGGGGPEGSDPTGSPGETGREARRFT